MPESGRARGVLVTAAGPRMHDVLHDLALPTFRRYAERWNYDIHAVDLAADGERAEAGAQRAKWAKIRILREALRSYPLAVWLDADVLIMRTDDDIATHLHAGHFQAMALEQVPYEHRVNPNTGVWVMRSCEESFAFLDAVERAGPQPGPWADQGAVLVSLGWDRGDELYRWASPGRGTRFLSGTDWLPLGWNQPYLGSRDEAELYNGLAASYVGRPAVPDPHALHFMGMTPGARYRYMGRELSALDGGAAAALSQPDGEGRRARFALHVDGAVVAAHDGVDDGEPQPAAPGGG
jgi:hypothetical protein